MSERQPGRSHAHAALPSATGGASRGLRSQGAAMALSRVLQSLLAQNDEEFAGVGIDEHDEIAITVDQAKALYQLAERVLPQCYSDPAGTRLPGCAMPGAVCLDCALQGRRPFEVG